MKRLSPSVLMMSLFVVLTAACTSAGGGGEAGNTAKVTRSSYVITAEEIATVDASTAFDVVQKLRPQFLRDRGSTSTRSGAAEGTGQPGTTAAGVLVYIDSAPGGSVDALRGIAASSIREIRYLSAADATTKYGTGHPVGVIEVRTR